MTWIAQKSDPERGDLLDKVVRKRDTRVLPLSLGLVTDLNARTKSPKETQGAITSDINHSVGSGDFFLTLDESSGL